MFAQCEGIVPAPESAHAICTVIDLARQCKERNEKKILLFNLSGHGLLDLGGYGEYLDGRLVNNSEPKELSLNDLPYNARI
jgi:tryptophan synthase beta chain